MNTVHVYLPKIRLNKVQKCFMALVTLFFLKVIRWRNKFPKTFCGETQPGYTFTAKCISFHVYGIDVSNNNEIWEIHMMGNSIKNILSQTGSFYHNPVNYNSRPKMWYLCKEERKNEVVRGILNVQFPICQICFSWMCFIHFIYGIYISWL